MQTILLKHSNIRYLTFNISKGANAARNNAVKKATGYFIIGLDDNDVEMKLVTIIHSCISQHLSFFITSFE